LDGDVGAGIAADHLGVAVLEVAIRGRDAHLRAIGGVEARADHQLGCPGDARAAGVVAAGYVHDGGSDGSDGSGEGLIERLKSG